MNSVNQPWAISDKYREKYGNTWAEIDFEFKDILEKNFLENPQSTVIGTLIVAGQREEVTMRDLSFMQTVLKTSIAEAVQLPMNEHEVKLKSKYVRLNVTELNRLYETIDDTITSIQRKYQLGLYL
jgi:hypothetical protein